MQVITQGFLGKYTVTQGYNPGVILPPIIADPRSGILLVSGLAPVNADPQAGILLTVGNAPVNADPRAGYMIQ